MRAGADTKERFPGLVMARWCWAGKDGWGWHGEGTPVKGVGAADLAGLEFARKRLHSSAAEPVQWAGSSRYRWRG